jgi:hypothetical protein
MTSFNASFYLDFDFFFAQYDPEQKKVLISVMLRNVHISTNLTGTLQKIHILINFVGLKAVGYCVRYTALPCGREKTLVATLVASRAGFDSPCPNANSRATFSCFLFNLDFLSQHDLEKL